MVKKYKLCVHTFFYLFDQYLLSTYFRYWSICRGYNSESYTQKYVCIFFSYFTAEKKNEMSKIGSILDYDECYGIK